MNKKIFVHTVLLIILISFGLVSPGCDLFDNEVTPPKVVKGFGISP